MKQKIFSNLVDLFSVSQWINEKLEENEGYSIKLPPSIVYISSDSGVLVTLILDEDAEV